MSKLKLEKDPKSGLSYRSNKMDLYVIKEARTYEHLFDGLKSGFSVLDIGGNIGSFVWFSLDKGAELVVTCEPEKENLVVLKKNFGKHDQVEIIEAAVTKNGGTGNLYVSSGTNAGSHSMSAIQGRSLIEVECVSFKDVLEINPDVLKVDIEGGEYNLPLEIIEASTVKRLAVELHLNRKSWREVEAPRVMKLITKMGFKEIRPPKITRANWFSLGLYRRKK